MVSYRGCRLLAQSTSRDLPHNIHHLHSFSPLGSSCWLLLSLRLCKVLTRGAWVPEMWPHRSKDNPTRSRSTRFNLRLLNLQTTQTSSPIHPSFLEAYNVTDRRDRFSASALKVSSDCSRRRQRIDVGTGWGGVWSGNGGVFSGGVYWSKAPSS